MRLNHNLASLNIFYEQNRILQKQSTAMSRISSGLKVNSAKDDPNALAQSERFRMQVRGMQMAGQNVQDGISMLQTAEGAMGSINDSLVRIRELTVQAGSGTNSDSDKATIKNEIDQLLKGINDTASNMEFNGVKLLANSNPSNDPSKSKLIMPTGANVDENVDIPMYDLRIDSLTDADGRKLSDLDVTKPNGIDNDLKTIDDITKKVLSINSKYGALENRFETTYNHLNEISDKLEGADSNVRDADISAEMLEFSKDNILVEAGNALMAQTNKLPQDVLNILQNMRR